MRYNPIIDKAPDSQSGVLLKTDFKQVLKFFRVMEAEELTEKEKADLTFKLFIQENQTFTDINLISEAIEKHISGPVKKDVEGGSKSFDFNHDAGLLLAAFRQVYSIDLNKESMHWWEFMELFAALPKGTHLMEVIEIRTKKIPKKGDKEYIRGLRRLKRLYSLDKTDNSEQVQRGIANLMG